jgi:anti-sigma B factor antagonist
MRIAEHKIGTNVVLEVLEPRLGADKAPSFKEAVSHYFLNGPVSLALDLGKVEFIDSSGLGAILSVLKRMPKGSELLICRPTEAVSSMFTLTRMDRVFTICKTMDEAVAVLSH